MDFFLGWARWVWASIKNFIILHLGLETLLGKLNQQSSQVMRIFFILCLISSHLRSISVMRNIMLDQHPS